ncbi:MAG TPA: HAMP domain-containing sensor histidine kinase [Anaeromyxobacteraceae bacterium]|nr:HAMP domain-containing sensor histidine kinase [Anaeromyxobacteraceae bacterium]
MASAHLLRSRALSASDARLVDRIDAAAHRMAHTVRDLLDEALARSGIPMPVSAAATDMRLIADEALLEAKIDNPDRWIVHGAAGDGAAEWDHDRIVQLLSNLLAHALDESSDAAPVSFAWWGEDDEVVVEIEYDPERAGREREWTLGLSVAREIARAHGGDVAMSDSSSGAVFSVALPRSAGAAGARTEGGGSQPSRRRSLEQAAAKGHGVDVRGRAAIGVHCERRERATATKRRPPQRLPVS